MSQAVSFLLGQEYGRVQADLEACAQIADQDGVDKCKKVLTRISSLKTQADNQG
jgi:hypothetical protein